MSAVLPAPSRRSFLAALATAGACGLFLLAAAGSGQHTPGTISMPVAAERTDEQGDPVFVDKIPPGYRDWRLISVAHEEGSLHSLGAVHQANKARDLVFTQYAP